MKIAIIGYSGSGKSTLAQKLAALYGVPVLSLDTVHFLPGWAERSREESLAVVRGFMQKNESWVIDGNYRNLDLAERLRQADRIFILVFPRAVCLFRAWKRYRLFRGRTRTSMAAGCPEKLDKEFIRWILFDGRNAEKRRGWQAAAAAYPAKTRIFRRQRQVDACLRRLGGETAVPPSRHVAG